MINYQASLEDMTFEEIKEANRFMWGVKGMLIPIGYSTKDVHGVLQGYLKRLWCNSTGKNSWSKCQIRNKNHALKITISG